MNTLSEFNISSREQLFKAADELQNRIDNCDDDERDELRIQYARIASTIRTYEEIVEGNYIDNLIRAERERREAELKNENSPEQPTQTVNRKKHKR